MRTTTLHDSPRARIRVRPATTAQSSTAAAAKLAEPLVQSPVMADADRAKESPPLPSLVTLMVASALEPGAAELAEDGTSRWTPATWRAVAVKPTTSEETPSSLVAVRLKEPTSPAEAPAGTVTSTCRIVHWPMSTMAEEPS